MRDYYVGPTKEATQFWKGVIFTLAIGTVIFFLSDYAGKTRYINMLDDECVARMEMKDE